MFDEILNAAEKRIDNETLPKIKEVLMRYVGKMMTFSVKEKMAAEIMEIITNTLAQ